jgi:two-component system OmpR family response regulator
MLDSQAEEMPTLRSRPRHRLSPHVLVVEDDEDLRRLLHQGLSEEGFTLTLAGTGAQALTAVATEEPGLIVIDIGLPDADGRDVCQALRARGIGAPVLFLTARDTGADRVSGFGAGGDDYLTKPFEFAELVARLQALSRRGSVDLRAEIGDLELDPVGHTVATSTGRAELTPTEFRILGALAARPGEALRRREMVSAAWPPGAIVHDNTLDVYVGRLRRKLTQISSETAIHTVHRVGYRLE